MAETNETLRAVCKICGTVHTQPFARGVCRFMCQEIFPGLIDWNGKRQMMVFHKAEAMALMFDWPKGDTSHWSPEQVLAYAAGIKQKHFRKAMAARKNRPVIVRNRQTEKV